MAVYVCCLPDIHLRTQCHPHSFTNLQGEEPSSRDLSYLEAVAVLLYSLSQLNVLHLDTC